MLDCKLCNYYHSVAGEELSGLNLGVCEFADMLFIEDAEDLSIEYPCSKVDYSDYICKKLSAGVSSSAVAKFVTPELLGELKKSGVAMLKFPDGIVKNCFLNGAGESDVEAGASVMSAKNR